MQEAAGVGTVDEKERGDLLSSFTRRRESPASGKTKAGSKSQPQYKPAKR